MKAGKWSVGSVWRRWDPHIHTPVTALANEYDGNWNGFFDAIRQATPAVEALGITDYVSIRGYREFRQRYVLADLPHVRFVFPNIEFRVGPNTQKGKGINLHLLVSPDDPEHERQIEEALARLTFTYEKQPFSATTSGLRDLGRAHKKSLTDEEAAFREGVNQFKPSFVDLMEWLDKERWLKRNSLIAVSPKSSDGTAGLACDDGFAATRKEIQRSAHIIFSGNPADRNYWLGEGLDAEAQLREAYGGLKPCLHGCDAHAVGKVLVPDLNRLCWIKAELTFEGLRQVAFMPRERVHLGERPPIRPSPNSIIHLAASGVGGENGSFVLNPGLVAVIGEKGSGKTALAELSAKAAGASPSGEGSFISKAEEYLGEAEARVKWTDGAETGGPVLAAPDPFADEVPPRVRYLSQHFVEQLCTGERGEELSDQLVDEIESVVFGYLDQPDRLSASSFAHLRELRCSPFQTRRAELTKTVSEQSAIVERKRASIEALPKQKARLTDLSKEIARVREEQRLLVPQGKESEAKQKEYQELLDRLAKTDERLRELKEKQQAIIRIRAKLASLRDELSSFDMEVQGELLLGGLSTEGSLEADLKAFAIAIPASAEAFLNERDAAVASEIGLLETSPTALKSGLDSRSTLNLKLEALKKALLADAAKLKRATELQRLVANKEAEHKKLEGEISRVETTYSANIASAQARRGQAYSEVIEQFEKEQQVLESLYEPVEKHLASGGDAERRLTFSVKRHVNAREWAARGEELLDLRRSGPVNGAGGLLDIAEKYLAKAWRMGTGAEAQAAIEGLVANLWSKGIQKQFKPDTTPRMFADWYFSTEHIQLRYGLKYDGTDLHLLSPGTRGIVLLILYLAIDVGDDRPLVIDQPEENLDPRSIYQVLCGFFREARRRRQVILVTHNANLVVNTDADQVIVASALRQSGVGLPAFTYFAGGLEDPVVRGNICELLEGGEQAFREREQRYFPTGRPL